MLHFEPKITITKWRRGWRVFVIAFLVAIVTTVIIFPVIELETLRQRLEEISQNDSFVGLAALASFFVVVFSGITALIRSNPPDLENDVRENIKQLLRVNARNLYNNGNPIEQVKSVVLRINYRKGDLFYFAHEGDLGGIELDFHIASRTGITGHVAYMGKTEHVSRNELTDEQLERKWKLKPTDPHYTLVQQCDFIICCPIIISEKLEGVLALYFPNPILNGETQNRIKKQAEDTARDIGWQLSKLTTGG